MSQLVVPDDIRAQAQRDGGVRYATPSGDVVLVIHHEGNDHVFANRCPHRRLPLDRGGRVMFSPDRKWIVCGQHGAKFNPLTGHCVAGPCTGKSLSRIDSSDPSADSA